MEALTKIAPALMAAQAELTNPLKSHTAQAGKRIYRYAVLSEIIDLVKPVLLKHKLAYTQLVNYEGTFCSLVTRLIHESGQFLESSYPLPKDAAPQDMGSAITYARRYALCAILGIAADEDDDGKAAQVSSNAVDVSRDALIEKMGEDSIGNKMLLDYCRANNLGDGQIASDLSDKAVATLVSTWPEVVKAIKSEPVKLLPKDRPVETLQQNHTNGVDVTGMQPDLAALMIKDEITKDQLKGYYTGGKYGNQKHLPDTVAPEKLPQRYVDNLIKPDNWKAAVARIKA